MEFPLAEMADAFAASLPGEVRLLAIEARSRVEALVAYLGALRSNRPVILITEPVFDSQGNIACILGGSVDLSQSAFFG